MISLFKNEKLGCYMALFLLTLVNSFTDMVPIEVNVTLHAILIMAIGSYNSLEEVLKQVKKTHIEKINERSDSI